MSESKPTYSISTITMPVTQTMLDDMRDFNAKPEVMPRITRDEAIAELAAAEVPFVSPLELTLDEALSVLVQMREMNFEVAVHNRLMYSEEPVKTWMGWWGRPGLKSVPFHDMILVTNDGATYGVQWSRGFDPTEDEQYPEVIVSLHQWELERAAHD